MFYFYKYYQLMKKIKKLVIVLITFPISESIDLIGK
jgi:hypothetical protein